MTSSQLWRDIEYVSENDYKYIIFYYHKLRIATLDPRGRRCPKIAAIGHDASENVWRISFFNDVCIYFDSYEVKSR